MFRQKRAFTLVELIVVITILAILGTIAFISFQGYTKISRDSVRISDLSTMKTSLELFHLDSGKYPNTTDGYNILYSGSTVWTQGLFGNDTTNNVDKLDRVPKDPLTEKDYTYSITNTKQEYQLAGMIETTGVALNTMRQSHAGDIIATAIVTGNYNGQIIKTQTGTICEILSVPTIVSVEGDTQTDLKQILTNENLVYNGYNNLPGNYIGSKYKTGGGFEFISNKLVVYSDDKSCAPLYDSEDTSARIELIENLQIAYSGTTLETEDNIRGIMSIDTTDSEQISLMSATFVNNNLGGSVVQESNNTPVATPINGECGIANNVAILTAPSANLCSAGTQTSVSSELGQFTWDCSGIDLGTTSNCTAPRQYVATFATTGGSATIPSTKTITYNEAIGTLPTTSRSGYTFDGWHTAAVGGNTVTVGTKVTDTVVYYAQWQATGIGSCTAQKQIKTGTSKHASCNTYNIIVCSGNGTGYELAACDVGSSAPTTIGPAYGFNLGTCASGYHIPTNAEWQSIQAAGGWTALGTYTSNSLMLNKHDASWGYYWTSSQNGTDYAYRIGNTSTSLYTNVNTNKSGTMRVRCMKN